MPQTAGVVALFALNHICGAYLTHGPASFGVSLAALHADTFVTSFAILVSRPLFSAFGVDIHRLTVSL